MKLKRPRRRPILHIRQNRPKRQSGKRPARSWHISVESRLPNLKSLQKLIRRLLRFLRTAEIRLPSRTRKQKHSVKPGLHLTLNMQHSRLRKPGSEVRWSEKDVLP